ncbi:hypothetical protein DFA_05135 [Cavenderia fasciculata]|uniref:Importin subunit alpha n=1 Tax=Cavenderia fasciculata TaxID=261658 RepID=F4PNF2_CACFS|nr:uncharacterized protein DFA_05135 [Cavenderia fasciculata]EGG23005.1 hypothetical protein DFA_05135 [Cavenderia fasciculata]|eukprot:XP_004360856.1 hypothetical protein DFA_05135 [Cavenderia fasciculata]
MAHSDVDSPVDTLDLKIPQLIHQIDSTDINVLRESVSSVRKALSIEKNPPIDYVIKYGFVPRLIQLLHFDDPVIQEEAAWALTNIASGSQQNTYSVVNLNIIPTLASLLSSPHPRIVDQSIWGLGNIAGDSVALRNLVLEQDVLPALLGIFEKHSRNTNILRNACWALSNLFRGKPLSDSHYAELALPTIARLLYLQDQDALCDVLWCISYVSDTTNERMQKVLDCNVVGVLIGILTKAERPLVSPALRTLGNFLTGDDIQTQTVLNHGALAVLAKLLANPKAEIRKEVCWCISNITSGNRAQIQQVIDSGILPTVVEHLLTDTAAVKKEAIWAISNACCGSSAEQIKYLVEIGSIPALVAGSKLADDITKVALEGLHYIAKAGDVPSSSSSSLTPSENAYKSIFKDSLRSLQQALIPHESRHLFHSILSMMGENIEEYDLSDASDEEFEMYDDVDVEVLSPALVLDEDEDEVTDYSISGGEDEDDEEDEDEDEDEEDVNEEDVAGLDELVDDFTNTVVIKTKQINQNNNNH